MPVSRSQLLSQPRSGAAPLGNSPGATTQGGSRPAPRPAPAPRAPAAGRPGPQGQPGRPGRPASRTAPRRSTLRTVRRAQRAVAPAPEFRNYQGIILAEFVAAELLVAGTPIAVRKNMPGLSPYIPRDMTKLLSLGLVYFLLELMSIGGQGWARMGAWFGGLILLATGLNEGANMAKTLDIFGGSQKGSSNG